MRLISITLVLLLMGCSTVTAKTTQQKYFAAKQDYATLLTGINQYASGCRAKPTSSCKKVVERMQKADEKVFLVISAADKAVLAKDTERLSGYLGALEVGLGELKAVIATTGE